MDLKEIIEKVEPPFYLYDMKALEEQIARLKEALPGIGVCYCMKASPILAPLLHGKVDKIEICSPGEYEIALRGGCPSEKILFSGVNKTRESVERVMDTAGSKCVFTIESASHFEIIDSLARNKGLVCDCYVRLSSGNQFGVDEEEFLRLVKCVVESEVLNFVGIHYFSGTAKKPKKIAKELQFLADFSEKITGITGEKVALEYGPGMGVDYFVDSDGKDNFYGSIISELEAIKESVEESVIKDAYSDVTFEHGRFIAACGADYFTKIIDIKNTKGSYYAILDGGLHQLNYFGSMAGMKTPQIEVMKDSSDAQKKEYVLAGSLCSVNDILSRSAKLPELKMGDVLRFKYAGAYSSTESIALFLSRDIPALALRKVDGTVELLRPHFESNTINDGSFI